MRIRIYGKIVQKTSHLIIITIISVLCLFNWSLAHENRWQFRNDIFDWCGKDPRYYSETLNVHQENLFSIVSGLRTALANKKLRVTEPKFSIRIGPWHEGVFVGIEIRVCEVENSNSDTGPNCLAMRFKRQ
ncbi:MAG: hypothetical protein A4S09_11545 [Proteobacteria bacterium SG_bin7]|nr:MAG: hypothetical protein A4S09_11545 [Proteobacteria bacterium SG_bin7]